MYTVRRIKIGKSAQLGAKKAGAAVLVLDDEFKRYLDKGETPVEGT